MMKVGSIQYHENLTASTTDIVYDINGSSRLGTFNRTSTKRIYEINDHLGNVRATFKKTNSGNLSLLSYTDYYPFGSEMPGRKFVSGDAYKHGYQGQFTEKDEEVNWDAFELRNWDGRLARWTTTDPYNQYWSPYLGMGNNPINGVDPDGGRADWFENAVTGEVKWFDNSSLGFSDANGGIWNNVGTEAIFFNGLRLTSIQQHGNIFDGFSFETSTFEAVSGRPLDNGTFSYSLGRQAIPNVGPVPEGTYWINPQEVQSFSDLSLVNQIVSITGLGGAFQGGTYAWGENRVWLTPSKVSVMDPWTGRQITRTNFSIHGGSVPGSAGCIDCHKNAPAFFNHLTTPGNFNSTRVPVIVKY